MRINLPSDCNLCICTLQVDCKQAMSLSQLAVSLSQPLCAYYNKKLHMWSIVDTWGCMQYFFKSCSAIVNSDHQFLFSQPNKDALTPSPPGNKAKLH